MSKENGWIAERLRETMHRAKIDGPTDLARRSKLSAVTVCSYARGDRRAPYDACVKMAEVLGVDVDWLYTGGSVGLEIKAMSYDAIPAVAINQELRHAEPGGMIPLYGSALAGPDGGVTMAERIDTIQAPAPISSVKDAYAVLVAGESMEPRYIPGETVYVSPYLPVRRGDFVVAQVTGEKDHHVQGYIKRFIAISDDALVLEQFNPRREIIFSRKRVKSVHRIVLAG